MATPQLSPGTLIREVDLTVGRADNVLTNVGAIAGPFKIGPVDQPVNIATEQQLINVFGKSISTDAQYEYWMSASSFLTYGGILKVVRTDGETLRNANSTRTGDVDTDLKIKNFDDYNANHSSDSEGWGFAAKNPGSWANKLKVCLIDDKADQTLVGIDTNGVYTTSTVFNPSTSSKTGDVGITTTVITGITTTGIQVGKTIKLLNGIIESATTVTSIGIGTVYFSPASVNDQAFTGVTFNFGDYSTTTTTVLNEIEVGYGVTQSVAGKVDPTTGETLDGYLKGIITGVDTNSIDVKITSYVSADNVEKGVTYQNRGIWSFDLSDNNVAIHSTGEPVSYGLTSYSSATDWYDEQTLGLDNSIIFWKSIAPKPISTRHSLERNGKNDALHVVVIDDTGSVTGIQGNLLEKHLFLSKASDSISAENAPERIFWKDYIALNSAYVYAGDNPSDGSDGFFASSSFDSGTFDESSGLWNLPAQDVSFNVIGNATYNLQGGVDYSENGGMVAELGDLITSYQLFSNPDEITVDYLIMGPGLETKEESQMKASQLIAIANERKDCVAVISPHRGDVLAGTSPNGYGPITNTETQTNNIIQFFSPLASSSYAVFDSGYKYTYDRFNNKFRYIPCNADVAGLMVRTNVNSYPWFSPAGQQRGILNNAIKLAYNPSKSQRDRLYPQRINAIINQPGIGILLFGDKTALGYASAFDHINVRNLFITIEKALRRTADAQLFEINDEITRANFVNIVDPYLRDIRAKRGVYDFLVICDQSNNTPDIIDNNEFRADIFLKPTKSINYVTLTFVATRTGVSFEEVAGRV